MKNQSEWIEQEIFREGLATFAVLDGASVPGLLDKLAQWQPQFECLYRGELEPAVAAVAPYLVEMETGTEFADWVISGGWGKHWGIFAIVEAGLRDMRQHLRRFITVHDESGKPLLFRYYDPRVLRVYLPTCNAAELAEIFGPVACYVAEGEEPDTALLFEVREGKLERQESQLK
jgi:Domain of unknown function (DUF4123)